MLFFHQARRLSRTVLVTTDDDTYFMSVLVPSNFGAQTPLAREEFPRRVLATRIKLVANGSVTTTQTKQRHTSGNSSTYTLWNLQLRRHGRQWESSPATVDQYIYIYI